MRSLSFIGLVRRITRKLILLVVCLPLSAFPGDDKSDQMALVGIANLLNEKPRAWLRMKPRANRSPEVIALFEGGRQESLELINIDLARARVRLKVEGADHDFSLGMEGDSGEVSPFSLRMRMVDMGVVLDEYELDAKRNVLRHPALPVVRLNFDAPPGNAAQARLFLENLLATNGISAIPDGEKFVLILPTSIAVGETSLAPAPDSKSLSTPLPGGKQAPMMEAAGIIFPGTDVIQVLEMYAALRGCQLLRPVPVSAEVPIVFKSQTELSRDEALHALEAHFRWRKLAIEVVETGKIKVVVIPASK